MVESDERRKVERVEVAADVLRLAFSDFVSRAGFGRERFVLTRYGKPVAALISVADLEKLEGAA